MKKIFLFLVVISISVASFAQTRWVVDPLHTFVGFSVRHMGISFVEGSFKKFDGSVVAVKPDLTDAKISFIVDVNSISTDVEQRNTHLKSDDFFNVEVYPNMTFESISFKKLKDNDYELIGKLTIRDVTKTVKFKVAFGGTTKDPQGNTRAGFSATTTINRLDYHIKYDPTGTGVGQDIRISLNLEFIQAK
ncbi:YceI family protein [Pedobacter sp.]|jgi:polyisoprenoid-binding protein YceI|uniref:YceI family protein n=1 Tax=Pedobacter sp. TaxID=1411316 RepID=UPI002C282A7F|nr:YceI family protein [Pedobacter sp.]HWW39782.1 YceI family protein [Pedobacter sp.]